jgi:hypothetical protein
MAGIDDIINKHPSLAPIANFIGMRKQVEVPAELPDADLSEYGGVLSKANYKDTNPLFGIPKSTLPKQLPTSIPVYRADPEGKYGGKNGLETLPQSRFLKGGDQHWEQTNDPNKASAYNNSEKAIQQLYNYARLNGAAQKYGYPALSPEEAAAFVLKEGRADLGHNYVAAGNKAEKAFEKTLMDTYNLSKSDANFLTALYIKKQTADRLKIPLAEAWNGTGVNELGQTGKDYASNYQHHLNAARHPKNAQLYAIIQQGIADGYKHGLPLKKNAVQDSLSHTKEEKYKKGGKVKLPSGHKKGGSSSLI